MTQIEHLVEANNVRIPDYSGRDFTEEDIAKGAHRRFVGGRWGDGGQLQLEFLKRKGLLPSHTFLDVGCGPFRAGRHMVDYLDAGRYYGIDANRSLIQSGYDCELTDEQRQKLPIANLRANDRFNTDFGVQFDFAIAQSVFTHVSLNHIRLCLYRLGRVMRPGGVFYASFNAQPETTPLDHVYNRVEGGRSYLNEQNVFWYHRSDLLWASQFGQWAFKSEGDYGSPHGQQMVSFTKIADRPAAARSFLARARRKAARVISPD